MVRVQRSNLWGAIARKHQRTAEFSGLPIITGPAVTPTGTTNNDLALRFCEVPSKTPPRRVGRFLGVTMWRGRAAESWLALSDAEFSGLAFRSVAFTWRGS
jgi:hypothetical protein